MGWAGEDALAPNHEATKVGAGLTVKTYDSWLVPTAELNTAKLTVAELGVGEVSVDLPH